MKGQLNSIDRRKNYMILAENSYFDDNMEKLLCSILRLFSLLGISIPI